MLQLFVALFVYLPQYVYEKVASEELQDQCSSSGSANMEENRVEKSISGNMIQYFQSFKKCKDKKLFIRLFS
jgi:hypothetical protein